jgi:membrane-associated HD superfamily phosphohydrolase
MGAKESKSKIIFGKILSFQRWLWGLGIVASLALIISPGLLSSMVKVKSLKVGDIAPRNIAAPEAIEFEDKEQTAREEERVLARESRPVYLLDPGILKEAEGKIEEPAFSALKKVMERGVVEDKAALREKAGNGRVYIKEKGEVKVSQVYSLSEAKRKTPKSAREYVQANLEFSEEETERYERDIIKGLSPVMVRIKKREMIVRRGMRINPGHFKKLEALANSQKRANIANVIGLVLLALSFVLITAIYLKRYQPKILASMNNLVLLGLIVIIMTGIIKVIIALEGVWPRLFSGYLLPVGAASMSIAILLGARVGILVTLLLSVLIGIITGNNLGFTIIAFLGGMAGIYSVTQVRHRTELIRDGVRTSLF